MLNSVNKVFFSPPRMLFKYLDVICSYLKKKSSFQHKFLYQWKKKKLASENGSSKFFFPEWGKKRFLFPTKQQNKASTGKKNLALKRFKKFFEKIWKVCENNNSPLTSLKSFKQALSMFVFFCWVTNTRWIGKTMFE